MKRVAKLWNTAYSKKLAEYGKIVSRRRIGRLIDEEGLECKMRRKFKATTNSKHNKPVAPNLLNRHFTTSEFDKAYVGDITYIASREGWLGNPSEKPGCSKVEFSVS
tara:strand:+ start:340 stop:660 length:321 start_codon:yes stop_codon:yes gene_type:complete